MQKQLTPARASIASPLRWSLVCLIVLLFGGGMAPVEVLADDQAAVTFERHIHPIFREFCFDCHGATEELSGGLDLRLVKLLERGGDSGPSIIPGSPDDSYLLDRLRNGEMPPGEVQVPQEKVQLLEAWLRAGAATDRPEPDPDSLGVGIPLTEEERSFWAFQPLTRPTPPEFPESERVRTPIDALVRAAMPEGLQFSPDADRRTLVYRVYLMLTGLPPTPEELQSALNDFRKEWYEELVETVLASPHYGEHWGRHWLDVAGYADSEGFTVADAERPWTWKYRDYVIRALNENKPFDRFITEQLAGDELAGPRSGDWTTEQQNLLIATGFLRMAADGTGSGDNSPEARNKVVADTLQIVSSSLLGMTLACAQCHDHRYDPLPQTDYFALRAVFEPGLNWKQWRIPNQRLISLYTEENRAQAAAIEEQVKAVVAEKNEKQQAYMQQALEMTLETFEEPLREQLREAYNTPQKERSEAQTQLLKQHPKVNITPGVLYQYIPESREELKKFDTRIAEIRSAKPPEEFVRAFTETPGQVPETHLFHRGDHEQPKQVVAPGGLSVLSPTGQRAAIPAQTEDLPTTGRRLAYARWLTSPENLLTPRVLVNRIWLLHFGRGIVSTPADFGVLGGRPSHPELLDWLADEFVQSGWNLKQLHRQILLSTVWRQASQRDPQFAEIDPANQFYWRKPLLRLSAESIRDRMLQASGTLDRTLFGRPLSIKEDETGQVIVDGNQTRRSLYIKMRRTQPVAMLQVFDAPVMDINCECRPVSTVATQSLMMMNGEFVLHQAAQAAKRASADPPPLPEHLAAVPLPTYPEPTAPVWQYGYGEFNATSGTTQSFTPLPHWTGSAWQGGTKLPDPQTGWAILNAQGGHPGNPHSLSVIRRWTAPVAGVLTVGGQLGHGSENGDGVRGRVVSSKQGPLGEWVAHKGKVETSLTTVPVQEGETLDFITDCRENENADSFTWPLKLRLVRATEAELLYDSAADFSGPQAEKTDARAELLPLQIAQAWQHLLGRAPRPSEFELAVQFSRNQLEELYAAPAPLPEGVTPVRQVLINICQALMTSNEFLYIE